MSQQMLRLLKIFVLKIYIIQVIKIYEKWEGNYTFYMEKSKSIRVQRDHPKHLISSVLYFILITKHVLKDQIPEEGLLS